MIDEIICGMGGTEVRSILNEIINWINNNESLPTIVQSNSEDIEELQIQGSSRGDSSGYHKRYTGTYNTDTVLKATHQQGDYPVVQLYDSTGQLVTCAIQNSNGNITWQSDENLTNPTLVIIG